MNVHISIRQLDGNIDVLLPCHIWRLCRPSEAKPIILNTSSLLRRRQTVELSDAAKSLGSNLSLPLPDKCLCLTPAEHQSSPLLKRPYFWCKEIFAASLVTLLFIIHITKDLLLRQLHHELKKIKKCAWSLVTIIVRRHFCSRGVANW